MKSPMAGGSCPRESSSFLCPSHFYFTVSSSKDGLRWPCHRFTWVWLIFERKQEVEGQSQSFSFFYFSHNAGSKNGLNNFLINLILTQCTLDPMMPTELTCLTVTVLQTEHDCPISLFFLTLHNYVIKDFYYMI